MKLVILESPYNGNTALFRRYALRALRHSIALEEAPFASHLLYPQILRDEILAERWLGIEAGHAWLRHADLVAVYQDHGISNGMMRGINAAMAVAIPVLYRNIGKETE